MKKTFPFVILSAFLLIEHTQGKSIKTEGTKSLSTFNGNTDSGSDFNAAVIAKLLTLSEEPLKLGIKLIQDTYDENLDDDSIRKFFNQILNDYRNLTNEKPENKIKLFLRLSVAFDVFSGNIRDEISTDVDFLLLAQEALLRRDVNGVAIEFRKRYDEFLKWLTLEIVANSTKFTSEQELQVNEFKNLCLQYKEETIMKRMPLVDSILARIKQ